MESVYDEDSDVIKSDCQSLFISNIRYIQKSFFIYEINC
jgi:hypothetical protein